MIARNEDPACRGQAKIAVPQSLLVKNPFRNVRVVALTAVLLVGADGLLVEVHHEPDKALSDGMQSILPEEFAELTEEVRQIAAVLHRQVN